MTGKIYTKSPLDRELADQVVLIIGVKDLHADHNFPAQSSATSVRIKIHDTNDNYPIFQGAKLLNPTFNASMNMNQEAPKQPIYELLSKFEENLKLNTRVYQLRATDADLNSNIKFKKVF